MRPGIFVCFIMFGCSLCFACQLQPKLPLQDEQAATSTYSQYLLDEPGCTKAGDNSCKTVIKDLTSLRIEAEKLSASDRQCSVNGVDASTSTALGADDKAWYAKRAEVWEKLIAEMSSNNTAVTQGIYKVSSTFRNEYLGSEPPPTSPGLKGKLSVGMVMLSGTADSSSNVYVCVWPTKPVGGSLDCTAKGATSKPAKLVSAKTDANGSYVTAASGTFSAQLQAPLTSGEFVSIVESIMPAAGAAVVLASSTATAVGPSTQCNSDFATKPYSDCDMPFSLIGGIEQSAQSSLQSETTGFLRVFTRATVKTDGALNIWAYVRLLGAPTTSSTNGVISVVTDPSGAVTTQQFSTIGTSLDYMVGPEVVFVGKGRDRPYSASLIAGFGATTPLQTNTLSLAFVSPPFGTVECGQLIARFPQLAADGIIAGTSTNAASASCLVNTNSPTTANPKVFAPITTVGFSNQDRSSFLLKDAIGIRTIDRFLGSGNVACGDSDPVNRIGPCERGIVDFIFGQDASITGGSLSRFIFKIDAVHPLPIPSVRFLYLFGSMSVRFKRNENLSPLILQSASISTLTGNGSSAVPNTSTVVLPLVQPNRDYYRFGVGININEIFKKLTAPATPSAGS